MAEFKSALPTIMHHEGWYSNHPSDPGKATKFGVSLRFLMNTGDLDSDGWIDGDINHDGNIDIEDVKCLTVEKASDIYRLYFWDKNKYELIHDQAIATKIFDLSVNMGSYAAHKVAQRAVRAACGLRLQQDGILGLRSFTAINMCKPELLMVALKSEAAGYYRSIKYKGSEDFLKGWLNRAYAAIILDINKDNAHEHHRLY